MSGGKKKKKPSGPRPAARTPPASRPPANAPASAAAPAAKRPTQGQRLEAARAARARKSRNTRLAVAGAVVVVVGLLVFNTLDNRRASQALRARLTAGDCTFDTRSDSTSASPNDHVAPAGYDVDPPAGGNHDPSPASAGTYTQGNAPSDARIVHALEHGFVAVWHRPDLDEAALGRLDDAVNAYRKDVLVVPRAGLSGQVAATAWGERLLCPTLEVAALQEFIDAYRNKGPERIPHPDI